MEGKIVEYCVVVDSSPRHMVDKVNARIKDGWELYGNPYVSCNGHSEQAMVKREGA